VAFPDKLSLKTVIQERPSSGNLQMKQQFWNDRRRSSKDCSGWTMQSTTATVRKTDTWMSTWTNKDTVKRRNTRVLSDVQLPRKSKL